MFQVILDMSPHRKLLIRRMLKDDVQKFTLAKIPSVYLIDQAGGTFTKVAEYVIWKMLFNYSVAEKFYPYSIHTLIIFCIHVRYFHQKAVIP